MKRKSKVDGWEDLKRDIREAAKDHPVFGKTQPYPKYKFQSRFTSRTLRDGTVREKHVLIQTIEREAVSA